ncbi:TPA: hypothetical protein EYP66_19800 [Candidatus Poribacteria bacterium]|nr:hypothetical protein [Candidatus Poribacteria bacterium]
MSTENHHLKEAKKLYQKALEEFEKAKMPAGFERELRPYYFFLREEFHIEGYYEGSEDKNVKQPKAFEKSSRNIVKLEGLWKDLPFDITDDEKETKYIGQKKNDKKL